MKPYAENKSAIQRRPHFQMAKIIDISSFSEKEADVEVFLSPYNSFLLMEIREQNSRMSSFLKLCQYKNGSLINYQKYNNMNDEFEDLRWLHCRGCLFMKNTNEFIVWYNEEIKFCRIQQNQTWKTIQVIQKIPVSKVALSSDEQTLFVCNTNISLYKKCQQQTRNQIWVCFFKVSLSKDYSRGEFFLDQAYNTFIVNLYDTFMIGKTYKNQKIRKLLNNQSLKRQFGPSASPLGLCEDQFIVMNHFIIQWNKQSRKILRKYKPKIGNQEITFLSYNQESRFNLAYLNQQLIFWEFQNGKIKPIFSLKDKFPPDSAQIRNNGQLLIKCGYDTSSPIVFYESAQ